MTTSGEIRSAASASREAAAFLEGQAERHAESNRAMERHGRDVASAWSSPAAAAWSGQFSSVIERHRPASDVFGEAAGHLRSLGEVAEGVAAQLASQEAELADAERERTRLLVSVAEVDAFAVERAWQRVASARTQISRTQVEWNAEVRAVARRVGSAVRPLRVAGGL